MSELERLTGARARITARGFHPSSVLAWSADLRWVAIHGFEEVVVVDRMTSSPHFVVPGIAAALSPDGRRLAAKAADHDVFVWDLEAGKTVGHHPGSAGEGSDPLGHPSWSDTDIELAWSDDGAYIASKEEGAVRVIDVAKGTTRLLPSAARSSLEFSQSSGCLATAQRGWTAGSFDALWGEDAKPEAPGLDERWGPIAIAGNCNRFAWAQGRNDAGHGVYVGVPGRRGVRYALSVPELPTAFAFSPDASQLAIAAGKVLRWNLEQSSPVVVGQTAARGKSVRFDRDGSLWLVDAAGAVLPVRKDHPRPAFPAAISVSKLASDGRAMLFGTETGEVIEWEIEGARVRRLAALGAAVVALDTLEQSWVAGLRDGSLLLGSRSSGAAPRPLAKHPKQVAFVAFGVSGTQVIAQSEARDPSSTSEGSAVVSRDVATGAVIRSWAAASSTGTAVSADGRRLLFLSRPGRGAARLEVVDLASGRTERTIQPRGTVPGHNSLSRAGDVIVSRVPSIAPSFITWSPDPTRPVLQRRGPESFHGPTAQASSPDGGLVALAEEYDRVTLWDARLARLEGTLEGAPEAAQHLSFSPESALVVATAAGRAWLWRTKDRRLLAQLAVTETGDALCAISPEGRVRIVGDGAPACASCRVGAFALPAEACSARIDATLLSDLVSSRRRP
ncbi:MAG: WD40 repeat domain-containing protein [Myxococcales bacterium]|nr:WD40 repeat domain-containing protein [Myxococcales bacterium]